MTDGEALLRAICEHPDEDTPRLAYADWCDENGDPDRAEFIRLQYEKDNHAGCERCARARAARKPTDGGMPICADRACVLVQEWNLLSEHPEWSRAVCPECRWLPPDGGLFRVAACPVCLGSRDLLQYEESDPTGGGYVRTPRGLRPLSWRCGFIHAVTVPRLADAWDGEPTPWARAVVRAVPTLREVRVADRVPVNWDDLFLRREKDPEPWAWLDGDSAHNAAVPEYHRGALIPGTVFRRLKWVGENAYPSAEAAQSALGRALAELARVAGSPGS